MTLFLVNCVVIAGIYWYNKKPSENKVREDLCRKFMSKYHFHYYSLFKGDGCRCPNFVEAYTSNGYLGLWPWQLFYLDKITSETGFGDFTYREVWWMCDEYVRQLGNKDNAERQSVMKSLEKVK